MGKSEKIFRIVLSGKSDANLGFVDLRNLLASLGFTERIKGSHHIFFRKDLIEILNLQPKSGKAKPYQVKQVRNLILKYNLRFDDEESV